MDKSYLKRDIASVSEEKQKDVRRNSKQYNGEKVGKRKWDEWWKKDEVSLLKVTS